MQSLRQGLRHVNHVTRTLQTSHIASTSRGQWHTRSYASWSDWVKEKIVPKPRGEESKEDVEAAREREKAAGSESFFDTPLEEDIPELEKETKLADQILLPKKKFKEHKYSTATFKISHRKLNMLGRQISGKPIDYAILQMQFSEKRASKRVKNMLVLAKQHAVNYKNLDGSKLVVSESWVTKGPNTHKRLEPRGRAHYGIRVHPDSRMTVILREGKTFVEKKVKKREKMLKAVRSAGIVREDVPLRNPAAMWGW